MESQKTRKNLILCDDYNICHEPIDIHDPVRNATNSGFLPEEREWMTRFLDAGFIDTFRLLIRLKISMLIVGCINPLLRKQEVFLKER